MYKSKKLANGLQLITAPMKGTKTVTVLVMVGTGSRYETRQNNGISHFLEHMFFKGTKKRPNTLAISGELDSIGAEFNAFTGKEYTGYWVKSDATKIDLALDVVSDMLLNSKFDSREIEREKGVIIEELNMYVDNPLLRIEDVFEQCLYGNTPAGWDTIGTKENIARFVRKDFTNYLNAQYNKHSTVVCLVGNFKEVQKKLENKAVKYFPTVSLSKRGKDWHEKEEIVNKQHKPVSLVQFKKTDQAHISLGVRTDGYDGKDRHIVKLISILLGGAMSSRMFLSLRERSGLAYYVRTQTESYSDSGYLTTRAGVPVDKTEQAIKIILAEYRKLKKILVGAKELKRIKDLIQGRTAISFEVSDNQANWYGRQAVMLNTVKRTNKKYKAGIITPEEYIKKMNRVTSVQIRKMAQEIFVNQGLNLAVIGPFKDKDKFGRLLKL